MSGAMRRSMLTIGGFTCLVLGGLGTVLPVLPTTPFVLLAAACFSRSSPRFERWLVDHPQLGPHILAWRRSRAIPVRAKILACCTMLASAAALVVFGNLPPVGLIAILGLMLACAAYIVSRPSR